MTTGSLLDHLTAARMALEVADTDTALEHVRAATRLISEDPGPCEATATSEDLNHYLHSRTFGHVCTALEGHEPPHLCRCGHTWTERFG